MVSGNNGVARATERCMRLCASVLAVAIFGAPSFAQDNDVLQEAVKLAETPPSFVSGADPILDQALTLAETPPAFTAGEPVVTAIGGAPVNLLIAAHRTGAERYSDTYTTTGKKRRRPIEVSARLRRADDANFTNRTRYLARRIEEAGRTGNPPVLARATTGAEFLDALVSASREGPIGNLVVYGHAASTALFMREDRGFYASVMEVARVSQVVSGDQIEKQEELHLSGARDLSDLEALLNRGEIRFARNAVIVFAGCGVAGKREVESDSIAARMTGLTGAKVIASIDVTDQSMGRGRHFRNHEYSRRTWVRFMPGETPERLNTKVIDALRQLNLGDDTVASGPQPLAVAAGGSN